jgi:hypothetical protein
MLIMANFTNISDRERLERLWYQQQKDFRISAHLRELIRKAFYWLITGLSAADDIQVWTCSDRLGNIYWNAYDPIYDRFLSRASETELRLWLEQRYNR